MKILAGLLILGLLGGGVAYVKGPCGGACPLTSTASFNDEGGEGDTHEGDGNTGDNDIARTGDAKGGEGDLYKPVAVSAK